MKSQNMLIVTISIVTSFYLGCGSSGNNSGVADPNSVIGEYKIDSVSCRRDDATTPAIREGSAEGKVILENFFNYNEATKNVEIDLEILGEIIQFHVNPIDISDTEFGNSTFSCFGDFLTDDYLNLSCSIQGQANADCALNLIKK